MKVEYYFIIGGVLIFLLILAINFSRIKKEKKKAVAQSKKTTETPKITPEPEHKKISNIILSKNKYEQEMKDRLEREIRKKEQEEEFFYQSTYGKKEDKKDNSKEKTNSSKTNELDVEKTVKELVLSDEEKAILISEILRKKV